MRYNHVDSSNVGGVGNFACPRRPRKSHTKNNQAQITET